MTIEIMIVLVILAGAVYLFVTEKLPVDIVGLSVMAALLLTGILTPDEGLTGFSNSATITVGAMFVLSAGLFKTGALNRVADLFTRLAERGQAALLLGLMGVIGLLSAFINNTAAVAIFLPIVVAVSSKIRKSPSRLLMPLSFASMFGGVCTLIGTSTNILISSIAEKHGQPAFGMFEFAPLGLVFFLVGTAYMYFVGVRLIPERRPAGDLAQAFRMDDYLTEIKLLPEAESVGKKVDSAPLVQELDIDILEIHRDAQRIMGPFPDMVLEAGDVLRVRCSLDKIRKLEQRIGIILEPGVKWRDKDLESEAVVLVEAVVAPNSYLINRTLKSSRFRNVYNATVLAIRHQGRLLRENLVNTRLRAGDVLLIEVHRDRLDQLRSSSAFVVVSQVELPEYRKDKIFIALLIILGVILLAAFNVMPIVVSAIVGSILLVVSGCITPSEAYQAIEWKVIFLLAGILPLGFALEKTGAASLLSDGLLAVVGNWGPVIAVSIFYLLTSLLTETMSNNATAVLLGPIAIITADSLGVDPRPFLMAVTFAASASFMTPVGYQTNTLIYGPGNYKFSDFARVGIPLNLIFWALATFLIPRFWPF